MDVYIWWWEKCNVFLFFFPVIPASVSHSEDGDEDSFVKWFTDLFGGHNQWRHIHIFTYVLRQCHIHIFTHVLRQYQRSRSRPQTTQAIARNCGPHHISLNHEDCSFSDILFPPHYSFIFPWIWCGKLRNRFSFIAYMSLNEHTYYIWYLFSCYFSQIINISYKRDLHIKKLSMIPLVILRVILLVWLSVRTIRQCRSFPLPSPLRRSSLGSPHSHQVRSRIQARFAQISSSMFRHVCMIAWFSPFGGEVTSPLVHGAFHTDSDQLANVSKTRRW